MATVAQIQKLRRKIGDFYSKRTGAQLPVTEQAFADDELEDLIDDAAAEASDGSATASDLDTLQESWCMMLSRADAVLLIAQDESRRIKWQTNNEIVDPSAIGDNLVKVAAELRKRYESARERKLKEQIEGVNTRPAGGLLKFNDSVKQNIDRNFNNRTVRRNSTPDHRF